MNVAVSKKLSIVGVSVAAIIGLISSDKIDDVPQALAAVAVILVAYVVVQGIVDAVKAWKSG